jgi:alpha-tubulin suppressor-like RCC1 family protein
MRTHLKRGLFTALGLLLVAILVLSLRTRPRLKLPAGNGTPRVALGDSHGVILAADGSLWVWGQEDAGWHALGLGKSQRQEYLRRLGKQTNWVDVAAGGSHTLALKADGTIWAWGENHSWQLGDGTRAPRSTPVQSVPGNDWKQIATGLHGLGLKRDGSLWAWGNNWAGVLGNGTTQNSKTPVQVGSSTNWVKAWANNVESIGLQSDGSLWFWGHRLLQFGPGGTNFLVPTRLSPDTNWVDVGLGDFMGFAIKSDGTLWAWGADADIYTGAHDPAMNATPRQVGTNHDWRACAPFWNSCTLLMKRDGSLWALDDALDQRGKRLGNPAWAMQHVPLRRIALDKDIVAFAGGRKKLGVAVTRDGELWTWGWALGQESRPEAFGRALIRMLNRAGIGTRWRLGSPTPVTHPEPWLLPNVD